MEKVIVITGGSGGIGEAIAKIFSPAYTVILHYHTSIENAKELRRSMSNGSKQY